MAAVGGSQFLPDPQPCVGIDAGGVDGILPQKNVPVQGWVAQLASSLGLGLLAYAVFAFDEGIPFPSLYTLVPTLGACC